MSNYTPIRADGRVVGRVSRGTFVKRVHSSRHFLRTPRSIALDIQSLDEAEQAGATIVRIEDVDTGQVYTAPVSLIWAMGFRLNRGHGEQVALPLTKWQRADLPRQSSLF